MKTNNKELLEICINDRNRSLQAKKIGFWKREAFDLALKYYFLLWNAFGRKTENEKINYCFVNEIKNNSMENNLNKTYQCFLKKDLKAYKLNFFRIDRKRNLKIGYFQSINLFLRYSCDLLFLLISCTGRNKKDSLSMIELLIHYYQLFLENFDLPKMYFLLMSDHHFFSTITALNKESRSAVLQHGLIQDRNYYYPILANCFFAWGIRSQEILENDPKITVAGTYKFDDFPYIEKKQNSSHKLTVLFCLSSLQMKEMQSKVDCLYRLSQKHHFILKVKCHPGSLFCLRDWINSYKGKNIEFYKEEMIQDIDFDLGIMEESTVAIDFLMMKKKFILYDNIGGYFGAYGNILPHGYTEKEIENCIITVSQYDFEKINKEIMKNELNNEKCNIVEEIIRLVDK